MLSALGKLTAVTVPDVVCNLLGLPLQTRVMRSKRLVKLLTLTAGGEGSSLLDLLEEISAQTVFWPATYRKVSDFGQRWANINSAMNYFRIAQRFAKINLFSAAADAYEKGLDLYPFFVPVRLELAIVKQKLSEHHVACRVLEEGVQCNPHVPMLWTQLAAMQMHLGLSQRAEASFAKALDLYDTTALQTTGIGNDHLSQLLALYAKFKCRAERRSPQLRLA